MIDIQFILFVHILIDSRKEKEPIFDMLWMGELGLIGILLGHVDKERVDSEFYEVVFMVVLFDNIID